jgi:hypothetical protein
VTRFLMTYEPSPYIWCEECPKRTRIVTDISGQVTEAILADYQRNHVCGAEGEPWDVGEDDEPPEVVVR